MELLLIAFDQSGLDALNLIGLVADCVLDPATVDHEVLSAWIGNRGGESSRLAAKRVSLSEQIILSATGDCSLWLAIPAHRDHVVFNGAQKSVQLTLNRSNQSSPQLPPPLGSIRDEFTVRRGTAKAYEVRPGEIVQIIDLEGQQCSDFMAFGSDALAAGRERMIDSTATRSMVRRAYPSPGLFDKFYDAEMKPLLRVIQDTCGRHDTFGLACTARSYEERGFPGHVNCSDNISGAMASYGVEKRNAWPAINFFWNTWIDPASQHILTEESYSRPGDYVALQALDRLVCVSTACPDDLDPINGWNPTDVHVRIYQPELSITRAVAYRVKEDSPMSISRESVFHPRTSALTDHFAPARDLWTPVSFPSTGTIGEYWACRDGVTIQDMSSLRKYDIVGPDAEKLLQSALTKDISRLAVWRGSYALMLDETGSVIDDGTLFRLGDQLFRWCCGTEESARVLNSLAQVLGLHVRLHDASNSLVNLSLQGPKSRDLLRGTVFTQPHVPALDHLKWFGVTVGRLHDRDGAPFMLSRTGYTGELGFELFCSPSDALTVWDALMEAGQKYDIAPMGNAALNTLRIEAGFAAAGAEFGPGSDAFESGLGFAVDLKKDSFTGRPALARNSEHPRKLLKGLMFETDDVPADQAPILAGERQVGVITSATRSPMLEHAIAMARVAVEFSELGTQLEVGMMDGRMKRLSATICDIPFVDPKRERARA